MAAAVIMVCWIRAESMRSEEWGLLAESALAGLCARAPSRTLAVGRASYFRRKYNSVDREPMMVEFLSKDSMHEAEED